ncbi:MAG: hypothetical protein F6K09_09740 [Merismopedia sp. SIO2A8]|nr:hypothetical protein [Symploca sp. SIO2B6]NET48989.1 hypothetical protein [Merismopedia sp. SIO2A8]
MNHFHIFHLPLRSQILSVFLLLAGLISPATAHKVQTNADVGATFHIEPNHNPRAGEPAKTWFALTRIGGQLIPLEQCVCKLAVYEQPSAAGDSPILEPPLKAISAEQYQGIPGADIIFPKAGTYELELSGAPKSGANFQEFNLKYTVNVGAGKTAPTSPAAPKSDSGVQSSQDQVSSNERVQSNSQSFVQWLIPVIVLVVILGIGGFWFVGVPKKLSNK